jgi:hypothetical protein
MTHKILDNVSHETLPKKEDIKSMFIEIFKEHSNKDGIELEIIQILALKMFLRETCKPNGILRQEPFFLKPQDAYEMFGKNIADEINEKVEHIKHMARLEQMVSSAK